MKTDSLQRSVADIYEICVFGDGTINEWDRKLVRYKLKPSYIQAKWFHFNHFGLNPLKIQNAAIMFAANASVIAIDIILIPLLMGSGAASVQIVPLVINGARLIIKPASRLVLQEYLEHRFNKKMFDSKDQGFFMHMQGLEVQMQTMMTKHDGDFTLPHASLKLLKLSAGLPMLNYIFFHYQMTEEYIEYRKKYIKKEDICFKTEEEIVLYFKVTFRMLRFYYFIEVHALNYFFKHSFSHLINFHLNFTRIRAKFMSTFYSRKKYTLVDKMKDMKQLLNMLNFKIQRLRCVSKIRPEIRQETQEQFQHFYFLNLGKTTLAARLIRKSTGRGKRL